MHGCKIMREYSIRSVNVYILTYHLIANLCENKCVIGLKNRPTILQFTCRPQITWLGKWKVQRKITLYENISNKDNHTQLRYPWHFDSFILRWTIKIWKGIKKITFFTLPNCDQPNSRFCWAMYVPYNYTLFGSSIFCNDLNYKYIDLQKHHESGLQSR